MKKYLIIFAALAWSCGETEETGIRTIAVEDISEMESDFIVDQVILLETDTTELLGSNVRAVKSESGFFVSNLERAEGIHHFSPSGESLGMIVEIGEAPGQIPRFNDYKVFEDSLLVMSGTGGTAEIHSFSMDHDLGNTLQVDLFGDSFYPNPDGSFWLYVGLNTVIGDHRLYRMGKTGKVEEKYLFNDISDEALPIGDFAFFEGDDRLLLREPFFTTLYQVDQDTIQPLYQFDLGQYKIPEKYWEMPVFEGFELINTNGFAYIQTVLENEQYLVTSIAYQSAEGTWRELVVLDRQSGETRKLKVDMDKNGEFFEPIAIENDHLLFIAYAPTVMQRIGQMNLAEEVKNKLQTLKEESNPVILYAKLSE